MIPFLLAVLAIASPSGGGVSLSLEREEYPALNAVLARHQHVDGRRPVLLASTPPGSFAFLARRAEDEVGTVERATVASFVGREALGVQVVPGEGLDPDVLILSREEKRALWPDADCEGGWARFRERFPNASGLFETSRAGINHDTTQAIVSIRWQTDCDSGGAAAHVLEKQQGVWHVVAVVPWSGHDPVERTPLTQVDLPDSFVASRRAPEWLSPRAREGEAKRQLIEVRYGEEWLSRCARYVETASSRASLSGGLDQWGKARDEARAALHFTDEDGEICYERKRYFSLRAEVVGALVNAAFGDTRMPPGNKAEELAVAIRRLGPSRFAALERHAGLFAPLSSRLLDTRSSFLPISLSGNPDALESEVLSSLNAASRGVAGEDFLVRYLTFIAEHASDPRTYVPPAPPHPGVAFLMRPVDSAGMEEALLKRERMEAREALARSEALTSAGLSEGEASLFERLMDFHRPVPTRPDDDESRKANEARLQAHRAALDEEVVDWFQAQAGAIQARIDDEKRKAEVKRWWSTDAVPRPGKGPSLHVYGAHPETDDARAPFSLSILDPVGKVVWRCDRIVVMAGMLEAPCLRAESVFARKGRHRIVLEAMGRRSELPMVTDGNELVVEVEVDGPRRRLQTLRVLPAPAGVTLTASRGERDAITTTLDNGSSLALLPFGDDWKQAGRLHYGVARHWEAAEDRPREAPSSALGPGKSAVIAFGPRVMNRHLVARAAVRLRTSRLARGVAYEARSNSLSLARFTRADSGNTPACISAPWPPTARPAEQFTDVETIRGNTLLLHGSSVFRLDGARTVPVWSTDEPLFNLVVTRAGQLFAQGPQSVFLSRDGQSFERFATMIDEPRLIVDAGGDVLVTGREGGAVRIGVSGVASEVLLPEPATWVGGSFDGETGVLVSACHTLAVTVDGGRSWRSRPAPTRGAVLLRGGTLYLAGRHGVFRSTNLGESFDRIMARPCGAISSQGERVAVACEADPDAPSGVFVSESNGAFAPVPGYVIASPRDVSWGENGELFALESRGLLLRGTPNALQPVLLKGEDTLLLLSLVRPFLPWFELDEKGRPHR